MTSLYASKAVPRRVFGEGELLNLFYKTMVEQAPGAWSLNEALLAMWNPNALSNDWVLPDGFTVHVKVMDSIEETVHFRNAPVEVVRKVNKPTKEGRSLGANVTHSIDGLVVREMTRRCSYNPEMIRNIRSCVFSRVKSTTRPRDQMVMKLWKAYEESGFLSARILGYLDQENMGHTDPVKIKELLESLPKNPFEVLSNHDCFRCLPNFGNDLRIQYNNILADIAQSDLLKYIVSQILGQPVPVNKLGDLTQKVKVANYSLS